MSAALRRWLIPFLLAGAMLSHAMATDIYRWVDEKGRTHVSDIVPPRYADKATRVDTSASAISPADQRAAQERIARDRKRFDEERAAARKAEEAAVKAKSEQNAGELSQSNKNTNEGDCAAKWNAYWASQECFAPFYRGTGTGSRRGVRLLEEAYIYCKPVSEPSAECNAPPDRRRYYSD